MSSLDYGDISQSILKFLLEKSWIVLPLPLYLIRYYIYVIFYRIRYGSKAVFISVDGLSGLSKTYSDSIQEKVMQDLQAHPALKKLRVIELPKVIKKKNIEKVEAFRQLSGCLVVIWGKITPDGLRTNGEQVHEPTISYTFLCPRDSNNLLPNIISGEYSYVAGITSQKMIQEKDSLEHINLCSKNILLTAQYIIGSTILIMGDLPGALKIFEPLYNLSVKEDRLLLDKVKFRLINCYELAIELASQKRNWLMGIEMCRKLLFLVKDHKRALIGLPFFLEQTNDFDGALRAVANLKTFYPKLPITIVDEAYIYLRSGRFPKAIAAYHRLRKAELDFNQLEVIEFLDQKSKEFPSEPALRFGLGFMYYFFVSEEDGKAELTAFIANAYDAKLKPLRDEANKIVAGHFIQSIRGKMQELSSIK